MRKSYALLSIGVTLILTPMVNAGFLSDAWNRLMHSETPVTGRVSDIEISESETPQIISTKGAGEESKEPLQWDIASVLNLPREKEKSCCFCGYDANHADAPGFLKACKEFFAGRAHPVNKDINCEVNETIPLAQKEMLIPQLLEKHTCREPLYLYHAEHGPVCEKIVKFIEVCVSNSPTCDINIASLSCQSFENEEKVMAHFKELQKKLGPDVTITACGNRLNGFFDAPACALVDVYKITQTSLIVEHGPCQRKGSICGPFDENKAHVCTNANGELTAQRCCRNATTLQSYTQTDSISSFQGKTQGVYAAEGAECSLAPCAQEGEMCAVAGRTYACTLSNGNTTSQSCCAFTSAGFQGKFSQPGASCPLPSCIEKENSLCETGGKPIACRDSKGSERSQICCGRVNRQGATFPVGFLSEMGKECECNSKKQVAIDAALCLTNGQRKTILDIQSRGFFNQNYCQYIIAPEGSRCRNNLRCDTRGICKKGALCARDADCYNKGRKFCAADTETVFGRSAVTWQSCKNGFCEQEILACGQDETCKKLWKETICIKRAAALEETA